jgi:hypothetical protein
VGELLNPRVNGDIIVAQIADCLRSADLGRIPGLLDALKHWQPARALQARRLLCQQRPANHIIGLLEASIS